MKTLDEVIVSLKICATNYCSNPEYGDCPYMDDKYNCNIRQRNADALYYLNTIYTTENLYHDAINELNAIKDEDWKDRNFPLIWEELKQMKGQPVWVIVNQEIIKHDGWAICGFVNDYQAEFAASIEDNNFRITEFKLIKPYYGITWQAYKKGGKA